VAGAAESARASAGASIQPRVAYPAILPHLRRRPHLPTCRVLPFLCPVLWMPAAPALPNSHERRGGVRRLAGGEMPFWNKTEEGLGEESVPMAMKRDDAPMSAAAGGDLLLGQGAEFEGKLTFAGTVRIDAKFKGSILTNDVLVVGEHARIDADITCGTVIIHGEVNGNIKAKTGVELRHPAKMRGNVESPSLTIEKGVVFHGESKMPGTEKGMEKPGLARQPGTSFQASTAPAAPA
jgi:cytoskeletal protein CcmA (bactofilin family)